MHKVLKFAMSDLETRNNSTAHDTHKVQLTVYHTTDSLSHVENNKNMEIEGTNSFFIYGKEEQLHPNSMHISFLVHQNDVQSPQRKTPLHVKYLSYDYFTGQMKQGQQLLLFTCGSEDVGRNPIPNAFKLI